MADHSPLHELIYSISTLTSSRLNAQALAEATIDLLGRDIAPARASLTLRIQPGTRAAFASTGEEASRKNKSRLLFSRNLDLRGHTYGRLEIDITEPGESLKNVLRALEVVVQQLSFYAEREALESGNEALWRELDSLEEELATSKKLARATGLVAVAREISFSHAKQWLEAESIRTGRPVELLADLLVIQHQAFGAPPNRKGAYAA